MATKRKYGRKASQKVKKVMDEMKEEKLKSGRSGKKVTDRKQAIAIGLSEARKEGGKVPTQKKSTDKSRNSKKTGGSKTKKATKSRSRTKK